MKEEKLQEAKRLYESANADQKYVLESLFPELAGSEDERILEIIKHCIESRYLHTSTIKGISQKQCFAWLEKQGEQKSIEWDEYDEMYVSALIAIVRKDDATGKNLRDTLTGWLRCLQGRFKKDKL